MRYQKISDDNYLVQLLQPTIKPVSEYSTGELAETIIKVLALSGVVASLFVVQNIAQLLVLFEPSNKKEKQKVYDALQNVRRSGYVSTNESTLHLTPQGRERIHRIAFDAIHFPQAKQWDKRWRLILYDIPNTKRKHRQLFACKLQEEQAHQLQKSVYVYPYDCFKELDLITEQLGIRGYVAYFSTDTISNEKYLRNKFGLAKHY